MRISFNAFFCYILGSNTMQVYFTAMKIFNKNRGSIILKSSDNYPKNGYAVKAHTIAVVTKKTSSNTPVKYWVLDGRTKKPLYINQHNEITLRPHLIKGEPVKMVVVGPDAGKFLERQPHRQEDRHKHMALLKAIYVN